MTHKTIVFKDDFSKIPFGRYKEDGKYSAQNFLDNILIPALLEFDKITIDFTGVTVLNYAFVEEVFGGIIRNHDFTIDYLSRIKFIFEEHYFDIASKIYDYAKEAENYKKID